MALSPAITPVQAEGDCSIQISYFDDVDSKVPVMGAEFQIYKVGDVKTTLTSSFLDGMKMVSYLDGVELHSDTTAEEVVNSEAFQSQKDSLEQFTMTTQADGYALAEHLDFGVYVGIETKKLDWHTPSQPFIVEVPYTTAENKLSPQATVYPKANLTGGLDITKKVANKSNCTDVFHVTVELENDATGTVKWSDGTTQTYKSGDELTIRDGETIEIIDIPAGTTYVVKEVEENQGNYATTYTAQSGTIASKGYQFTTITNTWGGTTEQNTGDTYTFTIYAIAGGLALFTLFILIYIRKKDKEEEEKPE